MRRGGQNALVVHGSAILCDLCDSAVSFWLLLAFPHPVTPGSGARRENGNGGLHGFNGL